MKSKSILLVSIIIVNKNEIGVEKTLYLLTNQSTKLKYEIIVVDASGSKLDDIYSKFQHIRLIPFVNKNKKKITISDQRNVGVKASKGNIIVFIDANCEPTKNWLDLIVDPIIMNNESIVAGGVLTDGRRTFHDRPYYTSINPRYVLQAPTINLALKKSVFNHIGLFDESLIHGEDVDLTWRAVNAGFKILYKREALITHDWGNVRQEMKRAYLYGQAKNKLNRKYKHRFNYLVKNDYTMLFYAFYVFGLPITAWLPYYPLLILIPIFKNMRSSPFMQTLFNIVYTYGFLREAISNLNVNSGKEI